MCPSTFLENKNTAKFMMTLRCFLNIVFCICNNKNVILLLAHLFLVDSAGFPFYEFSFAVQQDVC